MARPSCCEDSERVRRDQLFGSLIRLIERLPESGSLGPAWDPIGVEGALGPAVDEPPELPEPPDEPPEPPEPPEPTEPPGQPGAPPVGPFGPTWGLL